MTLGERYVEHLRAPRSDVRALAAALGGAGLDEELECYRAWTAHAPTYDEIAVGALPPPSPSLGDRWFDICELALMVNVGRSWLATKPTARWQMRGFLEVSTRAERDVQVVQPYLALDPARLTPHGDELARCTELTKGEAVFYAMWFGKIVPHQFDWQSALEWIPSSIPALGLSREWATNALPDEGAKVTITVATIETDPATDSTMIRGECTRDLSIGMRSSITHQVGLAKKLTTTWNWLVENVKLLDMCDRARFE